MMVICMAIILPAGVCVCCSDNLKKSESMPWRIEMSMTACKTHT